MIHKLINTRDLRNTGATAWRHSFGMGLLVLSIGVVSFASFGCATPTTNSNVTINSNASANTSAAANMNVSAAPVSTAAFATKEPEQYSLTMTLTGQGAAKNKQGTLPPQAIEFSRKGVDRRWALTLPVVGQIAYLEKADMRYLILPSRNQYVELTPEALGFKLGNIMTPSAMIEQLKPRTQFESMGTEPVNGRTATKYRFTGAADTRTQAGTVQSDTFVYIDEATGLPLRADLNFSSTSGGTATGVLETRDINLNPDATLFEVPAGYKKMTAEELKQQVQGFIQFIRAIAPMVNQQTGGSAPPSSLPPNVPQPAPQAAPTTPNRP